MPENDLQPFLKWAGGKRQLLQEIIMRIPEHIDSFYEPMCGAAAITFGILNRENPPKKIVLNDLNSALMEAFSVVRDQSDLLCDRLRILEDAYLGLDESGRSDRYYEERDMEYSASVDRVARFIFLNRTCFNGLYRVNKKGRFNVPHGKYKNPRILNESLLRSVSKALGNVEIYSGDYRSIHKDCHSGDFVYFDPPFEPISSTSSFTGYTAEGFGRVQQLDLRAECDRLDDMGVNFLVSNSGQDYIRGIYEGAFRGYTIEEVSAKRSINATGSGRTPVTELLISNPVTE